MKKLNFLKLSICAMLMTAAAVFTSCVDDNEDNGMPYLEVTPGTLSFDADGNPVGEGVFQVMTNRPWTLSVEEGQDWVRPSATEGDGNATVSFNIPASNIGQRAELTFSLSNTYGVYESVKVYVTQGDVVEPELVYKETCGAATSDPYPEAAAYTGWEKTGSGASTVTYAASAGVTVRGNLSSAQNNSAAYTGSGGSNLMFGTGATYFTIQDITLPANVKSYKLSFGASYFSAPNQAIFDQLTIRLSGDGQTWTDPVPYTFKAFEDGKTWNLAYLDFTLKEASEKLYVKFESEKKPDGNYRIDDMELMTGNGGTIVDLQNGTVETQVVATTNPVSQISATGATFHGALNVVSGVTEAGFQYAENSASIDWAAATKVAADAVALSFSKAVTNLTESKTYAVRAYATTADGDVTGSVVTFVAQNVVTTSTTIPALLAMAKDDFVSTSGDKELTAVVCGDPSGDNFSFGTLYVMTENATEGGNGIVFYNNVSASFDTSKYALGDKLKITLKENVAKVGEFNTVKQIMGVTDADIEKLGTATVTPIVTTLADLSSFVSMPVTVQNATVAAPGVWCTAATNGNHTFNVAGTTFTVSVNKRAVPFQGVPFVVATGSVTGIVTIFSGNAQVAPRNLADVDAFKVTAPTITGVDPTSLTWASAAVDAKPLTVSGVNIDGELTATSSAGANSKFTVSVNGTTVTVTPKEANTGAADITETLTIAVTGGNSIPVVLLHSKPVSGNVGAPYLWTLAKDDLGVSSAVLPSVTKGEPALVWAFVPVWKTEAYLGFDTNASTARGVQMGSGSKPANSLVLAAADYPGGVAKVVVVTSGASKIDATLEVKVGTTVLKSGGADNISLTNAATAYTFETSTAATGPVTLTWTNNSSVAIYAKSIAINPAN